MKAIKLHRRIEYSVGIDLHLPYLKHCKSNGIHSDLILCDARMPPIREKSFDVVTCVEFLEHLAKNDGVRLLSVLESVANRQIILTVPIRNRTKQYAEVLRDTVLQRHRSEWVPSEFLERSYSVRGMHGPVYLPESLAYWLSFLFPLTYSKPNLAYEIICKKVIGKPLVRSGVEAFAERTEKQHQMS